MEGDKYGWCITTLNDISIHTLRMEGDWQKVSGFFVSL